MSRRVAEGLFSPYVHGGYEITDSGRAAAAQQGPTPTQPEEA